MTDQGLADYLSYCLEGFFYGKVIVKYSDETLISY